MNPEPETGKRRWQPVRGDLPGHIARTRAILFKITGAVATEKVIGRRHRAIAGENIWKNGKKKSRSYGLMDKKTSLAWPAFRTLGLPQQAHPFLPLQGNTVSRQLIT